MSKVTKEKPSYEEKLARSSRSLSMAYLVLMPLGTVAVAVICKDQTPYNKIPVWLLIALALLFGASIGFIMGWLATHLLKWLTPTEADAKRMRLSLISIVILALLLSWLNWKDVPTNAQIDAIHNDPRFTAAIAEIKEKQMNPDLLMAAMRNGHSDVNRYLFFAIETIPVFVGLFFIFGMYGIIFRILLRFFGSKEASRDETAG